MINAMTLISNICNAARNYHHKNIELVIQDHRNGSDDTASIKSVMLKDESTITITAVLDNADLT